MPSWIRSQVVIVAVVSAIGVPSDLGRSEQVTAPVAPAAPTFTRAADEDPLPSWVDGPTKRTVLDFVARVTREGGPEFVPAADRIAAFDNDGTLWCERPIYVQATFALDRARVMADKDPTLASSPTFRTILTRDREAMAKFGEHEAAELVGATHAGMTPEDFLAIARDWLSTAEHPRFHRLYTRCVYQPQLELLAYLRARGFRTFIVTGGGIDFLRAFAGPVYGVPPEQVVGSSAKTQFEVHGDIARLVKLPELNSIDDKEGKPININLQIGRRPILAFGNSDGDLAMLQYTAAGPGPRIMLLVHHDDDEREYAYDRDSPVGRLDRAWDEARRRGWTVVSMKRDWNTVFPGNPR
jgi:phosphoglycolate phosphatase-like HAD superfamily hydrolase